MKKAEYLADKIKEYIHRSKYDESLIEEVKGGAKIHKISVIIGERVRPVAMADYEIDVDLFLQMLIHSKQVNEGRLLQSMQGLMDCVEENDASSTGKLSL